MRDYRPGDPLRRIHWKSWAKTGRPVVKEYQDEFFVRHGLILDTFQNTEKSEKIADIVEAEKPVEKELVKQAEEIVINKEQWLIQLASFSQKPNAIALQSKVKQLGLTANIEHVGTVYRVRIGPESSRAAAEELVAKLADELKLEPQILTVKPDSNK